MEIWFTLAILSAIFFGFNGFIKKVIAHKWLEKNHFLLYSGIMQTITTFIYFLYNGSYFYMTLLFWFLIVARMVLLVEKNSTMIESLKYIDSSLFFPSNRLITMWAWFFIWLFLFWEYLEQAEVFFLVIWILTVLLLWYKKDKSKNKDLSKWIKFLFLSSLFVIWTSTINKYVWENHNIALYMFLCNIVWIAYISLKMKLWKIRLHYNKEEIIYWNIYWFFWFIWFVFLLLSLKEWKLVIVQLISTIAILIPIILSYLFLKEEVNKYRVLWLVLFLGNLGLFYLSK